MWTLSQALFTMIVFSLSLAVVVFGMWIVRTPFFMAALIAGISFPSARRGARSSNPPDPSSGNRQSTGCTRSKSRPNSRDTKNNRKYD